MRAITDDAAAPGDRPLLEIDLARVVANWRVFAAAAAGVGGRAGAVVKADAYGLGLEPVAVSLLQAGAREFFVANTLEGLRVRAALGDAAVIWVFAGPVPGAIEAMAANALRPVLNSLEHIDAWRDAGAPTPAALHLDTGMNRLGLAVGDIAALHSDDRLKGVAIDLVMSHLACADAASDADALAQRERFESARAALEPLARGARVSLANSAGALAHPSLLYDLARPGIGLYGGGPFEQERDPRASHLAIPLRLSAPVLQVRTVGAGDSVGYGRDFRAPDEMRCATVALGYADGFLRSGAGRGYGLIAGRRAPLVGRVSMDLVTLDVTRLGADVRPGVMVEFYGPDAGLEEPAMRAGTLSYEALVRLSGRAERRYTNLSAPLREGVT